MKYKNLLLAIATSFCITGFAYTQQKNIPHYLNTFHISGDGSWDYLSIQPNSNKLFVSHGTEVNIIDKNNGDSLACIKGLSHVHGFAFVTSLNKGYITSGADNNVVVIDLSSNTIIKKIPSGQNPDAIMYEPGIKRLVVCNGKTKDISLIDPITDEVTATIPLNGKPEVALSDGKYIYANLEDKNEIAVIDITSKTVIHRWSLKPSEAPTGMAMDINNHLLFSACSDSNKLLVIDTHTGKIISTLPIGGDCDGVWFDKEKKMIYASNKDGTITVINQVHSSVYKVAANLISKPGAKTITVDNETHKIYVSAASTQKNSAEEKPQIIAGTFSVMVFGF